MRWLLIALVVANIFLIGMFMQRTVFTRTSFACGFNEAIVYYSTDNSVECRRIREAP